MKLIKILKENLAYNAIRKWSKTSKHMEQKVLYKIYTFYQEKAKDPEVAEESIEGPWVGI